MINIRMQSQTSRLKPKITVIGVGGAGGNAVNNMINSNLEGCEFLVCNTDAQALEGSNSAHKIQLGVNTTRGLGAGANPEIGRAAAEESIDEILSYLEGSNMVFVTAGMGGGTGTGAAPVIAQAAREAGILTIGVITKPFHFEGTHRMKLAEAGIAELQRHVDTLIIIPNQNLFRIANEKTTFADAFKMADEVLQSGVRGVTDLMVMPGLINLDFADVRAVMAEMGKAMMGTGEAMGERRAVEAAEAAISNPLLDDVSMKGARGVLVNIMGGLDMTLFEVDEAMNRVRDEVDPDANIIFGSTFDSTLNGSMRVSVVATGIDVVQNLQARPLNLASAAVEPSRRPVQQARPAVQAQARTTTGSSGYNTFERTAGAREQYVAAGIPSSILPSAGAQGQPMMSHQPSQVVAQKAATTVAAASADGWDRSPEPQMTVGHASSAQTFHSSAATARKLEETEDVSETESWMSRPQTQTFQRSVPPVSQQQLREPQARTAAESSQPRATRQGNSFIPPKPVDPRTVAIAAPADVDLFDDAELIEAPTTRATAPVAEKAVKKSPSLFERFTMQRKEEAPMAAPARAETSTKLSVEAGGKQEDDELDIPAFLRRQAN